MADVVVVPVTVQNAGPCERFVIFIALHPARVAFLVKHVPKTNGLWHILGIQEFGNSGDTPGAKEPSRLAMHWCWVFNGRYRRAAAPARDGCGLMRVG